VTSWALGPQRQLRATGCSSFSLSVRGAPSRRLQPRAIGSRAIRSRRKHAPQSVRAHSREAATAPTGAPATARESERLDRALPLGGRESGRSASSQTATCSAPSSPSWRLPRYSSTRRCCGRCWGPRRRPHMPSCCCSSTYGSCGEPMSSGAWFCDAARADSMPAQQRLRRNEQTFPVLVAAAARWRLSAKHLGDRSAGRPAFRCKTSRW
jgi:hypothetical protein